MTEQSARSRWRCECGEQGRAYNAKLALVELWAHDERYHRAPARRAAAAVQMLADAA